MDVLFLLSVERSLALASNVVACVPAHPPFKGKGKFPLMERGLEHRLPMSYLLRFMFIFLITEGLVHFGLVCNIHQPELHTEMTFESKAFLFSNDETGEKYGDAIVPQLSKCLKFNTV